MNPDRFWSDAQASEEGLGDAFEGVPEATTSIFVNGAFVDVEPGKPFGPTIMETARNAGLGKFRVFHSGGLEHMRYTENEEIMPEGDRVPEAFTQGVKVELRPYDEAAHSNLNVWSV